MRASVTVHSGTTMLARLTVGVVALLLVPVLGGDLQLLGRAHAQTAAPVPAGTATAVTTSPTDPDAAITARTAHIVVSPQPEIGAVGVIEVWVIRNETDRTRVAGPSGFTLRFELPLGAQSISVRDPSRQVPATLDGLLLSISDPFPPGEREVVIDYVMPYSDGEFELNRVAPLPTDELRLLVMGEGAVVESPDLPDLSTSDFSGQPVAIASGGGLAAGAPVRVRVTGLPAAGSAAPGAAMPLRAPPLDQRLLPAMALIVALAGGIVALNYSNRTNPGRDRRYARQAAVERERVLAALAELDTANAGLSGDDLDYSRRRAVLLDRALALTRQRDMLADRRPDSRGRRRRHK